MSVTKQRTFYVNGDKIQIKSRPKSYMRNPNGFNVWITLNNTETTKYFIFVLTRAEAEDKAFVKWVKANA